MPLLLLANSLLTLAQGADHAVPLATVVIGGIVSATVLTLPVLPVLYRFANRHV